MRKKHKRTKSMSQNNNFTYYCINCVLLTVYYCRTSHLRLSVTNVVAVNDTGGGKTSATVTSVSHVPPASVANPFTSAVAGGGGVYEGMELLHVDWVQELPEDLDVCIAQRDFEAAVDLIQKSIFTLWPDL